MEKIFKLCRDYDIDITIKNDWVNNRILVKAEKVDNGQKHGYTISIPLVDMVRYGARDIEDYIIDSIVNNMKLTKAKLSSNEYIEGGF